MGRASDASAMCDSDDLENSDAETFPPDRPASRPTVPVPSTSSAATARLSMPASASIPLRPHVRQFYAGYAGILEVWIRSSDGMKLQSIPIQKFMNERYKSVASIIPDRDKISVIFGDPTEANAFVRDKIFPGTFITIPSKCIVDVDGAIRADDLVGLDDVNDLVEMGEGVFGAAGLRPCRILNAVQVSRTAGDNAQRVLSNTVKVTFEGNIMPKYVSINNLRIPTRLFHKSPMFCDKCQTHGHTSKFCRRKHICARCNSNHSTVDCSNPAVNKSLCPRCAKEHHNSRSACPYFQQVAKDYKAAQIASSHQRYQQTVSSLLDLNANPTRPQQTPVLDNANFPPLRNSYASLAEVNLHDDTPAATDDGPASYAFPPPPKNPYVARSRGRTANKRRRDGSFSVSRKSATDQPDLKSSVNRHTAAKNQQHSSRSASATWTPVPRRERPTNASGNPPSAALKLLIITIARSMGLNDRWMAILEAVVDPLLETLLPHAQAIFAAVSPHVRNIH